MTPEFLQRLRKIDKAGLTARDVLILHFLTVNPGSNGNDIVRALNVPQASSIKLCMKRLAKSNFVEDRRREDVTLCNKMVHSYYTTGEGELFLKYIEHVQG